MILNPHEKSSYFTKHWPKELQQDVLKCVEEVFQEQFLRFNNTENAHTNRKNKSWSKGSKVLESGPLSLDEAELENKENKDEQDGKGFEDENGWNELFSDDNEDDFDVDIDIVSD
ncbi:hypothetical protein C0993_008699 [Termitomyces sp. T159_Od127]|nr:hypothetical protein C0993_008699 [Termitomyces sp. T159_Od127]